MVWVNISRLQQGGSVTCRSFYIHIEGVNIYTRLCRGGSPADFFLSTSSPTWLGRHRWGLGGWAPTTLEDP